MTTPDTAPLRAARVAAEWALTLLVLATSSAAFAESYHGLWQWALEHGYHDLGAVGWPLLVDSFIAGGELTLFLALVRGWPVHARLGAWAVTAVGLTVSVGGNVGHVITVDWLTRATAAVPPLAAAASLWLGLAVLKRVVAGQRTRAARASLVRVATARWRTYRLGRAMARALADHPGAGRTGPACLPLPAVVRVPVAAMARPAGPALPRTALVPVPPVPPRPEPPRAVPVLTGLPGGLVPRPGPVLLPAAEPAGSSPEARAAHAYQVSLDSPGRPISQRDLATQYLGNSRRRAQQVIAKVQAERAAAHAAGATS